MTPMATDMQPLFIGVHSAKQSYQLRVRRQARISGITFWISSALCGGFIRLAFLLDHLGWDPDMNFAVWFALVSMLVALVSVLCWIVSRVKISHLRTNEARH